MKEHGTLIDLDSTQVGDEMELKFAIELLAIRLKSILSAAVRVAPIIRPR
jgi:hypothetical protein